MWLHSSKFLVQQPNATELPTWQLLLVVPALLSFVDGSVHSGIDTFPRLFFELRAPGRRERIAF
jgi:hypothetical protein